MCNFFSFWTFRATEQSPLRFAWRWWADSHSDILFAEGIDDSVRTDVGAKCELSPVGDKADWLNVSTWTFSVDEPTRPAWFDADVERQAREFAERIVRNRTKIGGEIRCLYDDFLILGGNAKVIRVGGAARVLAMSGKASVTDVSGNASVTRVYGKASVTHVYGEAKTKLDDSAKAAVARSAAAKEGAKK